MKNFKLIVDEKNELYKKFIEIEKENYDLKFQIK